MVPIDWFDAAALAHAERPAVIDGDTSISYRELTRMSEQVAGFLSSLPQAEPVPVALFSPNDYRVVAAMLGVMRAGAVIVPLHAESNLATAVEFLNQVAARCMFFHSSLAGMVGRIREQVPTLSVTVCLDAQEHGPSFADLMAAPAPPVRPWIDPSGNRSRPVYYWATSGSTGTPKVVIEDCGNFDATLKAARAIRRANGRHVALAIAPMSHGGGPASFGTLSLGGTVVVIRTFDPRDALHLIERHGVTEVWLSPTALYLLLDTPDRRRYDVSSLRCILLGMAGIGADRLRQAVAAFGPCLMHSYGQIETGFVTMLDAPTLAAAAAGGTAPDRLRSSGLTVDLNRFAVMDEDDRLVGAGVEGEIVVRGAGVKRYLDPSLTAAAQRSGWHRTGDLGYVDDDGFLYVTGRVRDVVNMAGFKISAAEVEQAILELDAVQECAVVPSPDPIRGESITAVVTARPGCTVAGAAVIAHCRRRLGAGKTPRLVAQWPELPRSPAGKIDKRRIRSAFGGQAPSPAGAAV